MNAERLLTLAAHLKSDRRGHKRFDFGCYSIGARDPERHLCGSSGCAFGELPVIWPDAWEFGNGLGDRGESEWGVKLKSHHWTVAGGMSADSGAREWFELEDWEVQGLFYPDGSLREAPIDTLGDWATARQVGDRFIAFVKWREEQADEEREAAAAKADADASFREAGLDPAAIDAARAADDRKEDARVRELEAKCPDSVLGPPQVYRIVYRTIAGAKPTFIHVRAESETRALMAFIDETSPLQVSSLKLDNEYDGPLLNERENFWPASNEPKVAQEDTGDNDADDIQTGPVVREGT